MLKEKRWRENTAKFEIEETIKNFYTDLYSSTESHLPRDATPSTEPDFLVSEIRYPVERMPNGKAPGEDGISVEVLKAIGFQIYLALAKRFTRYLRQKAIPTSWKTSREVIIHKKGDREDLAYYRPITIIV